MATGMTGNMVREGSLAGSGSYSRLLVEDASPRAYTRLPALPLRIEQDAADGKGTIQTSVVPLLTAALDSGGAGGSSRFPKTPPAASWRDFFRRFLSKSTATRGTLHQSSPHEIMTAGRRHGELLRYCLPP